MTTPSHPSPATAAYVDETLALLGDRDPLGVMAETPLWLTEHLDPLEASILDVPEAEGKWSITQVLAHLADTEIAFGWRARLILTQDRAPLTGFDEGAWVTKFDYANADPAEAYEAFAMLRLWNLRVWKSATAADLQRVGIHSERGEESFDRLRRMVAGHDLRHRRQIERIIRAVG
jgi:uncharacterized damage-inducible protein DinB